MAKFKIPFGKKATEGYGEQLNNVERQYNKAFEYVENGITEEAVKIFEQIADIGAMDPTYKKLGCDSLKILGELFDFGKYKQMKATVDKAKAARYYERYSKMVDDGDLLYKLGRLMLDIQNFSKAITYLEAAASFAVKPAFMQLGLIYENGLNRIDEEGNKSDYIIPVDLEKAKIWYGKLAEKGDDQAKASIERIEYNKANADSIEFEEKDKLYSEISERRKAKGVEHHFKSLDATMLQYQYTYVHDQVEGYIHKLPKDWVKSINVETDEEYYAPSHTYTDFAIYVAYTTVPKESERTIEDYLRYQNEAFGYSINITPYITEYANGMSSTFYHPEMEKGIVTFAFKQKNRWACIRFICTTMDIIEQYNEIIFEVANSFAFIRPTLLSDRSANRTDIQYYNEAVYYFNMENYEKAMLNAKTALENGSEKASYLLIELYFDEDSPYQDIDKALVYAKQLFAANKDPDLAFLIGNIYDQQLKDYKVARDWYEKADQLHHKRVPFYLGRFYYYGLLDGKRDGDLALKYFKQAVTNSIFEADPYAKDIEKLGDSKLQATVDAWERAVESGIAETAFKVAMNKKEQVFYLADEKEIEDAFLKAISLGSVQAAYQLGAVYAAKEKQEGYEGPIKSLAYFEKALDSGYDEFSKEHLFQVITYKASKNIPIEEKMELYFGVALKGYLPAINVFLGFAESKDENVVNLYEELKKLAMTGDAEALTSMNKIEQRFPTFLISEDDETKKVIRNKYFHLSVPKECVATINDEGGTIKMADSVIEFAVAEMPIDIEKEEDYLRVFRLIYSEYTDEENAEVIVANSRMVGSGMLTRKVGKNRYKILLVSAQNQYLFNLTSMDWRELLRYKEIIYEIAVSLVETGEIFIGTGDANIGLSFLLSGEKGRLSIRKEE